MTDATQSGENPRTKAAKIARLRERVKTAMGRNPPTNRETLTLMLGILDLLGDEL